MSTDAATSTDAPPAPSSAARDEARTFESQIPARLDRLPWSRWHWMVLAGLGAVWILDGLEVTIVGAVGSTLTTHGSGISITASQIGYAAATYVLGACLGALFFGHLTDRFGRRKLFLLTLGLYLLATVLTATSHNAWMFCLFRFFTGMGIGGEYAAINSAIDELIPARVRGTVDLIVNGSFWLGTSAGAAATLVLLDPNFLATDLGWRVCFFLGATLGVGVLLVRRTLPESPRWLMTHGRNDEAERIVSDIERRVARSTGEELEPPSESIQIEERGTIGILEVARVIVREYPKRSVVGVSLFIGQAFLYNAVFFTFSLVLTTFYHVASGSVGYYIIAFAAGNLLGPLLLGRLFDVVGRRVMIGGTYLLSGVMLAVTAWLFDAGTLTALTQTIAWAVIFFFASAGASAAYLTVSEIFPMETRALAIALFYAVGTGVGGIIGPSLFGNLVASKRPSEMAWGYVLGAALMVAGGVVELCLGVDAERKSLEDVASPLSAANGSHPDDERAAPRRPSSTVGPRALPRRHRLPPTPVMTWSPGSSRLQQSEVPGAYDGEVDVLVALLEHDGPLTARQLQLRSPHQRWGPGRFWAAMRAGVASGQIQRTGDGRYVAAGRP